MTLAATVAAAALRPSTPGATRVRTPAGLVERVRLRSDAGGGRWRGDVRISFANVAARPLRRVTLRLWDDGIGGCTRPLPVRVRVLAGGRAGRLAVDCSALPVELARPLPRGRRAQLRLSLAIDVPDRDDRFGRIGREVFVGNALPLPAVTDAAGLHLDPYVRDGESFYSLTGDFTLALDTPRSMAVAATGSLRTLRRDGAGRLRRTFVATHVRDAAWVAGALASVGARTPEGTRVRVLYPPAFDRTLAREALQLAQRAMRRYAAWFGPYPYPEVDVVLAPFGRFSGMEYPTLVLSVPAAVPIAHELAHQWWYGIVGDDEYRAPWLDESFATWSERAFDGTAGAGCAGLGWPAAPGARVTATMAYWRTRPRAYGTVVYGQGACALQALSARLGRRRFLTLMRGYVARHRFGVSTTAGFEAAAQAASPGASLAPLWRRYRIG